MNRYTNPVATRFLNPDGHEPRQRLLLTMGARGTTWTTGLLNPDACGPSSWNRLGQKESETIWKCLLAAKRLLGEGSNRIAVRYWPHSAAPIIRKDDKAQTTEISEKT